jgi:murein DD-endopeptidase MepM/ murein hydrolase activator NlpD
VIRAIVWLVILTIALAAGGDAVGEQLSPKPKESIRKVADLSVGETAEVALSNGQTVRVQLLDIAETADALRGAVVQAKVRVRIGDQEAWLASGNYALPVTVGTVQVDCPITKNLLRNSGGNPWALEKDARLRFWPAGWPWIEPGSYGYPARQRWFASMTQMANEPCYVDVSPTLKREGIYYHDQLDIGGAEGLIEVVAATDGVVVVRGEQAREDIVDFGYQRRYDRVAVLDERGWLHAYSHLKQIAENVVVGERIHQGDPIGRLGKEGSSGGWSHLHYGIFARQPSGKWGTEAGYAYLVEAYRRACDPAVMAVARPHQLCAPGDRVTLDGSRSWTRDGTRTYRWTLSDGTTAEGAQVERTYTKPGIYSEILRVTDGSGHEDYDFAVVQVYDAAQGKMPPGIHATYAPALTIEPGDPVTFLVRVFNAADGTAVWDFGDGSGPVTVRCNPVKPEGSDALAADGYVSTVHRYAKPGHYLVRVEHAEGDAKATARLHVLVEGD